MSTRIHQYSLFLSLLHKYRHCRGAIQQIHSHFLTLNFENANALAPWNSIIKHYSLSAFPHEAVFLFKYLKCRSSLPFDSFSYSYLIKACASIKNPSVGGQFHCLIFKVGFDFHVYVQTALVNLYVDCGCLIAARKVFDEMPEKNLVTWNVLMTGFIKCGDIKNAMDVFGVMPEKNVVSWTGIIDGCTRNCMFHEALLLFREMVGSEEIKPNEVTLLAVYPAIWNTGCLEFCRIIHAYTEKSGLNTLDIRVTNCLVDSYAKIGSIESAWKAFKEIIDERRNLVSWTSIISGFAMHGMATEASECYKRMENAGLRPNRITFLSVLNACSHGGLVVEGLEFYKKMVEDCGIVPDIKHYGCLIDMLGRAGRLKEAEEMAMKIPNEIGNAVVWRTLLGACSFHGNIEMGERVTRKLMEIESKYGGDYVLLSNIFSGVGRFLESERVRGELDHRNASKVPGITLV